MIKVERVTKSFGDKVALNNISFVVNEGEIFGFLGPSGSGKTTMINILIGQLPANSGKTELLGKDSQELLPSDFEELGLVGDTSGYYEKLSLYKNLLFFAKLYDTSTNRIEEILKQVDLYDSKDTPAEKLSTGMRQRMLLARALINYPKVLFLDEPTSGLDPTTSKKIHKLLQELKEKGTTIFLTTHDMNEATLLCDDLALLNKGHLVEQGSPKNIIQKYNTEKKVELTYSDTSREIINFEALKEENYQKIMMIHSCEPTLEDIFIKLTGEKLDA
ncbi:ABC transporter ATP-binding protein [Streptococcus gordonii]|jgi:ABC transporter, ATP-binding protein|uniref:ABC transporter ATP-binding protein n=1 Tax=Streptococcus gordonii TaxID=1302 RepID=UPI00073CC079|nr:ABC transporter ATP-binding protein [Streptococcus gordonii]KTF21249.1 ABC transporter ATP-binding protein [Streptococcus gordonii]KXC03451.1 ABC transporter ATP-binding protein [Streptococcus gordonii]MBZ2149220.1 ABC transporter ATP-binding protein [Streptococcus gordonii]QWZ57610.1 ABC transporter ATP-binding protein [Streptococcus gordonii]SQF26454.1 ABC transporter ATP-binding protein [Streptococcus gordonii]